MLRTDCADFDKLGVGHGVGGYVQRNVRLERRVLTEIDEERPVLVDRLAFRL